MKLLREAKSKSVNAMAVTVILASTVGGFGIHTAVADVGDENWMNSFGDSESQSWDQPFDRSFVKQWETNPPRGYPTLSQRNIAPMKVAIKRYAKIVSRGGWKPLPMVELRVGSRHKAVAFLRRRLELSGDLRQRSGFADTFDYYVEKAVKRFQKRHGLTPTGFVDKATILAFNVPASARLRQLRTNMTRVHSLSASANKKRYVMVNIPAAQIEAVEGERVVSRHSAVVGKIDRQTPILRSKIHAINFNPFWRVPKSIVRKDLVPKAREYARRGKDILSIYRMTVYDGRGRKLEPNTINWFSDSVYGYSYKQDPWKENSMGFVKINFHNKHSVYMHDTPSKSLFGRNFRAHSSGCIRVQNVKQLVTWLLNDTSGWDRERVVHMERSGERMDVNIKKQVPVYFVYVTAWANEDGTVHFRRDLYRRDGVGLAASTY